MPQPIMTKYKHGEFGADYVKAPKEKIEAWSKTKITQGSFNK